MITIIIDGYNFIFNSYFKLNVKSEILRKLRDETVNFLSEYYNVKRNKVIVVFDGYNTDLLLESKYLIKNIEVIYSKKDEKADDVIVRLAKGCKSSVVVTNDNEIKKNVENANCSCISPAEFKISVENIIDDGYNGIAEHSDEEEEYVPSNGKRKGNPRRLSKKERLKNQKMKKL